MAGTRTTSFCIFSQFITLVFLCWHKFSDTRYQIDHINEKLPLKKDPCALPDPYTIIRVFSHENNCAPRYHTNDSRKQIVRGWKQCSRSLLPHS